MILLNYSLLHFFLFFYFNYLQMVVAWDIYIGKLFKELFLFVYSINLIFFPPKLTLKTFIIN